MSTEPNSQVLALLAKEWDMKGPPGIIDVSDIVAALPLAPSDTLPALKDLYSNGLIDMNKFKTSAFLTTSCQNSPFGLKQLKSQTFRFAKIYSQKTF